MNMNVDDVHEMSRTGGMHNWLNGRVIDVHEISRTCGVGK
jgi:hypothetical protein